MVGGTDGTSYMTSVGATGETGEVDEMGERAESTERVVTVELDLSTRLWDCESSSPPEYMSARIPLSAKSSGVAALKKKIRF